MEGKKTVVVALTQEDLSKMLAESALIGAQAATDTLQRAHKEEQKQAADRRLHNARLLLKNYRMLKESCKNAIYNRDQCVSIESALNDIMNMNDDRAIVESIRRTSERTAVILAHIDKMLDVYRTYSQKNGDREKRQYNVIFDYYIARKAITIKDLAQKYKVSRVTIYDDLKAGEGKLSALLFGIDGLRFY